VIAENEGPDAGFPTGFATERRWRKPDLNHRSPRDASFRDRICRLHSRQPNSRRERERQHEDTGRLRGTNGSNPASSRRESGANPTYSITATFLMCSEVLSRV